MDTGGPHDRNTRQCRKTLQQIFLVSFLHGLYTTCTGGGGHDRNTCQCRKTRHSTFCASFLHGFYTSHVHGRTQQILLVSFLHGLYPTHTRETPKNVSCVFSAWVMLHMCTTKPTTVTSASVAKQDIQLFVCLFCMGSIPHMYTGGPNDRNTRQCRTTTQQTFPVSSLHGLYLTCTREDPATATPASVAKQQTLLFVCLFCMGYTSHVHGRSEDPTTITPASFAKQHNKPFLYGLHLTSTREDRTTVTPASVAKHHNKPCLCLFCMGYTSHVHGKTPRP